MNNYFSKNLKYLRESKNMSQSQLARQIGVSQTTIARWEDDDRCPTVDSAYDVSVALNLPISDLICKDLQKLYENDMYKSETIYNDDNLSIQYESKSGKHISDDKKAEIISEVYKFINEENK